MNSKKFFWAMLAVGIMSACSESEISDTGSGKGNETKGDAYVSVKINLPSSSSARTKAAGLTENYDNGDAKEFAVKDLTLVFFKKEASGEVYTITNVASTIGTLNTVEGGLTLPAFGTAASTPENITTTDITDAISVDKSVTHVVALANIGNEKSLAEQKIRVGNTYNNINEVIKPTISNITDDTKGFMMTSAPSVETTTGESTTYKEVYLTPCTTKPTAEAAVNAAKDNKIYLERTVAKVELVANKSTGALPQNITKDNAKKWYTADGELVYILGDNHLGDKVIISGWALDVTNTVTYPFRKLDVNTWSTNNTTVWQNCIYPTNASRVYFAIDPNYDKYTQNEFLLVDGNASFTEMSDNSTIIDAGEATASGQRHPQYCLENTFNTDYQRQNGTTRIVIKAQYTPKDMTAGETWYTLNNLVSYYNKTNLEKALIELGKANTYDENGAFFSTDVSTVTFGYSSTASGTISLTSVSDGITWDATKLAAFNAIANIVCYENGICYYAVRIRHFSDDELYGKAWTVPEDGTYTANDLGRYGLVRNNSYRVMINNISRPGDPNIPTTPDEPDDSENSYIACDINVLSWALRPVQSEDL